MTDEVVKPPSTEPILETPATKPPVAKTETAPAEPEFLRDRLDRERRSVLKDLGIKLKRDEDPSERIAQFQNELTSDREENKTLKQKLAANETQMAELASSKAAVKVFAEMEFNSLTEAQQKIVIASAGDDPNERLKTIAIMKASGGAPAPTATQPATPAPIPAPAQTAPGTPAPAPTSSTVPDVRAEHARLQQSNPLEAAAYLLQNRHAFYQQK